MNYFPKFIFVGVINTALGYLIIFSSLYLLKISPEISNALGYGVGLLISYILNRCFTFNSSQVKHKEFLRFFTVFCIAYATNFIVLLFLIHRCGVSDGLSQILAGMVYVSTSFFMNKHYVFERV